MYSFRLRLLLFTLASCVVSTLGTPSVAQDSVVQESDDDLVSLIIELLQDRDDDIRALAFEQIRTEAPGGEATKRFAAELSNLPADSQVGLLRALAVRGDAAARPAVLDLLANSDQETIRAAAVGSLGPLGDASDVPRLVEFLSQGSAAVEQAARRSLVQLQGDGVAASMISEMEQAEVPTRVALMEILTVRRELEAIPTLLEAAVADDAKVRQAAMTALAALAGPEHIPGLVRGVLAAEEGSERAAAEKQVMLVAMRIADEAKRADPLLEEMKRRDQQERLILLSTVGRIGGPAALEDVMAAIASEDPATHSAGIRALSNWPDASVAPELIELAKTDEHEGHQVTALRALIRVAPLPDGRSDEEKLALLKTAMEMSTRDEERKLALARAAAIRLPETLRFVLPFVDQPEYAEQACLTIVELAHHRGLRDANKEEFHAALDTVLATSTDPTTVDRANRYKQGQTWVRPK